MTDEAMRIHDALRAIAAQRQQLHAREASLLVQAEELALWRDFGCATFFEYLERYCDLHPRTAREHIRVARALKHPPLMHAQLAAARIPYSTARELTRVATPDTEAAWLLHVAGMSPREIEQEVSGREHGDHPTDPRDPDHVIKVVLEIRSSTYAQLVEARTRFAADRGAPLTDDELLLALCRPDRTDAPYQIAITTCRSCAKAFQVAGGREIEVSVATLARTTCDATHIGDLEADAPQRAKSTVSARKRRQVLARDGFTCRVPGCRSQRYLDIHHIRLKSEGGTNRASNLVTICSGHHQHLHDGKLSIAGEAPHALVFRFLPVRGIVDRPLSRAPVDDRVTHEQLASAAQRALDQLSRQPTGP
jgi:hypothetical protein